MTTILSAADFAIRVSLDKNTGHKVEADIIQDISVANGNIANININGKTFIDCDFSNCKFNGVNIELCEFINCNFKNTALHHLIIMGGIFKNCNMNALSLAHSQCHSQTNFTDCDLRHANFYENQITDIYFDNCNLESMRMLYPNNRSRYISGLIISDDWVITDGFISKKVNNGNRQSNQG